MSIETVNGHEWVTVATIDGEKSLSVSISRLLYDEEGNTYLLAFEGEHERRLYLDQDDGKS